MSKDQPTPEGKDPAIWDIAKKRAGFKSHLVTYVLVSAFFWGIWYFSEGREGNIDHFPWPAWSMFGWGIWLAFDFAEAYFLSEARSTEREYEKLINKKQTT